METLLIDGLQVLIDKLSKRSYDIKQPHFIHLVRSLKNIERQIDDCEIDKEKETNENNDIREGRLQ